MRENQTLENPGVEVGKAIGALAFARVGSHWPVCLIRLCLPLQGQSFVIDQSGLGEPFPGLSVDDEIRAGL